MHSPNHHSEACFRLESTAPSPHLVVANPSPSNLVLSTTPSPTNTRSRKPPCAGTGFMPRLPIRFRILDLDMSQFLMWIAKHGNGAGYGCLGGRFCVAAGNIYILVRRKDEAMNSRRSSYEERIVARRMGMGWVCFLSLFVMPLKV